jgi:type IV fimbrial biogenesis protein FimT
MCHPRASHRSHFRFRWAHYGRRASIPAVQARQVMRVRGISLVEMLVVVGITVMLLAMASPGFGRIRASAALRTATSQTMAALHLARRMALAQGRSVTVCPTLDGLRCDFRGRQWVLFANQPGGIDSRREQDEPVLRRWMLPPGIRTSGSRGYATFRERPGAAATVTFEFRHRGAPGVVRSVVVSQTGRPRLGGPA